MVPMPLEALKELKDYLDPPKYRIVRPAYASAYLKLEAAIEWGEGMARLSAPEPTTENGSDGKA